MSHVALQRVMVRMLFDAAYTERVLTDPDRGLGNEDLTSEERRWLARPDPRAWRADPDRPRRAMSVLLQEYPTSFALIVAMNGDLDPIADYFSAPTFHQAIQARGSMALNFGDYLAGRVEEGAVRDRRVLALARLEQAIARLHRTSGVRPPESGHEAEAFLFSPDKALHRAEGGTADLHEEIHRALAEVGKGLAPAVLDPPALPALALDPARPESLLLELARDDGPRVKFLVGTAEITEELYALLDFARIPRSLAALAAEVTRLGADEEEAPDVIADFIADETLVPAPSLIRDG